ncbi:hypothetical protein HK405_000025 [Cladochytrium tenue]|nr:hypothetical protein HK405_000025 [Cladochytrium tenue]
MAGQVSITIAGPDGLREEFNIPVAVRSGGFAETLAQVGMELNARLTKLIGGPATTEQAAAGPVADDDDSNMEEDQDEPDDEDA